MHGRILDSGSSSNRSDPCNDGLSVFSIVSVGDSCTVGDHFGGGSERVGIGCEKFLDAIEVSRGVALGVLISLGLLSGHLVNLLLVRACTVHSGLSCSGNISSIAIVRGRVFHVDVDLKVEEMVVGSHRRRSDEVRLVADEALQPLERDVFLLVVGRELLRGDLSLFFLGRIAATTGSIDSCEERESSEQGSHLFQKI